MRTYELARELGIPSKELLERLHALGFDGAKTASSNVPAGAIDLLTPSRHDDLENVPEQPARETFTELAARETLPEASPQLPRETSLVAELQAQTNLPSGPQPQDHRRVPRRLARWAAMVGLWIVFGLAAGFVLAITVPIVQGNRSLTVLSGSMEPAITTGDVVVVEQIPPLDARIGDIVSFRDPEDPSRLITHRVRAMEVGDNEVTFVTKGDANTSVEQWRITPDGQIGRVVFRVPKIGYVLFYLRGSLGRLLLIVFPALLLGAYELWRIWRPTSDESTDEGATQPGEATG
ncbi:MAG: signal peptidase I [Actinomycetota bacterium]